jgi:hypothetical protein
MRPFVRLSTLRRAVKSSTRAFETRVKGMVLS